MSIPKALGGSQRWVHIGSIVYTIGVLQPRNWRFHFLDPSSALGPYSHEPLSMFLVDPMGMAAVAGREIGATKGSAYGILQAGHWHH